VETPICEGCFPIHGGEDCKATTVDDQGRKVCIFCCDGVPCPGQKRIRKLAATPQAVKRNGVAAAVTISRGSEGQQVDPVQVEARTCKVAGCNEVLGSRNQSGLCGKHRHRGDPRRNSSASSANGSTNPAKRNGSVSVSPPTPDPLVAERVNRLLANLPIEDKLRMCEAWLAGRI